MALPDVSVEFVDGALGVSGGSTDQVQVKLGACSSGTANQLYAFTTKKALVAALGEGPLVESAAHTLTYGRGPVYCMPLTTSSGTVSAVTKANDAQTAGTGTMAVTGNPLDVYDAQVMFTSQGTDLAAATAAFRYSLDGGTSWSESYPLPASGTYQPTGTGLTLTFTDGMSGTSFKVGDVHSFTSSAPSFSVSALDDGIDALLEDARTWFLLHVVGEAATVSDAATLAAALDVRMQDAANAARFAMALMECPADTDANIKAAFTSTLSTWIAVAAGHGRTYSAAHAGRQSLRSIAWAVASRLSRVPARYDIARVKADEFGGPLAGLASIDRDERITPGLDDARFITARTIINRAGYYATRGRMMAEPGSDYTNITHRRVANMAASTAHPSFQDYMNENVEVDRTTGLLTDGQADAIDDAMTSELKRVLIQGSTRQVQDVLFRVDRSVNVLQSEAMAGEVYLLPFGVTRYLTVRVGFNNPNVAA